MPKHTPSQLDPRSPLVLDTRELPRRPGVLRTVKRVVPAPADLGLELIGVPEGADLSLDLRLESVSEGVLVSGTVSGPLEGECGRCLRAIHDSLTVTIQELYAYENSTTDETADEDEVGRMQGDLIDLEPALRDAVVLALPTNPLCRQDCPGLCPECGAHWDDLPADHSHDEVDPRWAALSRLNRKDE
ncbi:YceD family protein [Micromonospora sp. NPDC049559]|uniref:YceD family protein n=1 Tax=Micromonospora sp. NPDC049559 TaxID=3155923 RepID=UPI003444065B